MKNRRQELEIYKSKEKKENDRQKRKIGGTSFYSGVFILSLSAVIVKIIGLVYKIPMLRLLGSEGIGYFNSAYEIYALLCIISTAGLPVAMSVMISKEREEEGSEKVFRTSMKLFLALGVLGTALMLVFSYPLARFLGSDKSFYSILAIAPTLFFICVTSAYRGYFQGLGNMMPTAVSQIIEALGKLLLGLLFASVALNAGLSGEKTAAFAVLGLLLGGAISSLYLMTAKRAKGKSVSINAKKVKFDRLITKELLSLAIPITLSAAVVSVTKMIDMTTILRRLQGIGYSSESAFSVYGSYTTLCLPLFSLAPALVSSVAMPILPKLSRAISDSDSTAQLETVNDGLRLTAIISMPISVGLALYSREILELLFRGESEAITLCAPLLTVLALSVSFSSMVTLGNAVLQAYGHPTVPLLSMCVGAIVKTVLAYLLIGNNSINILGAPISTFFCDLTINLISFTFICKYLPGELRIGKALVRPFVAAVLSISASKIAYGAVRARLGERIEITLAAIAAAGIMYLALCLAIKAVDINEIRNLMGRKKQPIPIKHTVKEE